MNKARWMQFGKFGAVLYNPIAELTFSNTVMNWITFLCSTDVGLSLPICFGETNTDRVNSTPVLSQGS